jgi:hypothetical protein
MLGLSFLVQSYRVFLLFSFKVVLFSSNFFNLGAYFFGKRPFLFFRERFLNKRELSSRKLVLFTLLVPGISALQIASFFTINAHHRDHHSHLSAVNCFDRKFITPYVFTKGCIEDFDQTWLIRQIDST